MMRGYSKGIPFDSTFTPTPAVRHYLNTIHRYPVFVLNYLVHPLIVWAHPS